MKLKYIVPLFAALLVVMGAFSGCGDDNKEAAKGETASQTEQQTSTDATPKETTVVLETTPDGGTIEKDSEGNKITKDQNGSVIAVEDKNGNAVDVEEYVSTHSWVQGSSGNSGSSASNGSGGSDKKSGSSSANGSGSSGNSGSGNNNNGESKSSGTESEIVEEEIPVIIATVPDADDITGPTIDI